MTNSAAQRAAEVRLSAGLFALRGRGLLRVEGTDRVRWLDGMLSNEIANLVDGSERSGCYALLLSPKARILADLHVLRRGEALWLELSGAALESVRAHLERYVVADDVTLSDVTAEWARFALEGPRARAILEAATGGSLALAAESCTDLRLAGTQILVAAYGWSGGAGYQLFVPVAQAEDAVAALRKAGGAQLVEADEETLEVLRIEAGIPRLGAELDEDVLPAEAGLVARAVSLTKGCFTGQEIVARLESRGQVNHLLVGLGCDDASPPTPETPLVDQDGKRVGEVTSACVSASAGAIALAYVRRPFAVAGCELRAGSQRVRVAELPFVPLVAEAGR